jgi:hypothetical protein
MRACVLGPVELPVVQVEDGDVVADGDWDVFEQQVGVVVLFICFKSKLIFRKGYTG